MLNKLKKKNNKGFTLVELLVVIAIIGILAVVAVPSLMKNIDKSKAADIVSDYNVIKTAVMTKYADNTLPTSSTELTNVNPAEGKDIEEVLEISDLSNKKDVTYLLEITVNDTTGAIDARLNITAQNNEIANMVSLSITGKEDKGDKVVGVDIIK